MNESPRVIFGTWQFPFYFANFYFKYLLICIHFEIIGIFSFFFGFSGFTESSY
jgi:hypothetical protein